MKEKRKKVYLYLKRLYINKIKEYNILEVINMNDEILKLKQRAEEYRFLYQTNQITRDVAKNNIMPYIDEVNKKSKELAKKYNQKPKKVTFITFIR